MRYRDCIFQLQDLKTLGIQLHSLLTSFLVSCTQESVSRCASLTFQDYIDLLTVNLWREKKLCAFLTDAFITV